MAIFETVFLDIFLSKAQTGAASLVSSWCWILKNAKAPIEFILIVNKMVYLRFEMLQSVLTDFKKSHTENFIGGANKLTIIRADALGELCESGTGKVTTKLNQIDSIISVNSNLIKRN